MELPPDEMLAVDWASVLLRFDSPPARGPERRGVAGAVPVMAKLEPELLVLLVDAGCCDDDDCCWLRAAHVEPPESGRLYCISFLVLPLDIWVSFSPTLRSDVFKSCLSAGFQSIESELFNLPASGQ